MADGFLKIEGNLWSQLLKISFNAVTSRTVIITTRMKGHIFWLRDSTRSLVSFATGCSIPRGGVSLSSPTFSERNTTPYNLLPSSNKNEIKGFFTPSIPNFRRSKSKAAKVGETNTKQKGRKTTKRLTILWDTPLHASGKQESQTCQALQEPREA